MPVLYLVDAECLALHLAMRRDSHKRDNGPSKGQRKNEQDLFTQKVKRPACTTGEGAGKEHCSLGRFLAGSSFFVFQVKGHEHHSRESGYRIFEYCSLRISEITKKEDCPATSMSSYDMHTHNTNATRICSLPFMVFNRNFIHFHKCSIILPLYCLSLLVKTTKLQL